MSGVVYDPPATPESDPLSLHDALPIFLAERRRFEERLRASERLAAGLSMISPATLLAGFSEELAGTSIADQDRKSTRLNSSHLVISYAVFCLKKKKVHNRHPLRPQP